ncbi:MAG: glycosyltransferase [Clostridia bacterium]|nr:glycosyltransferase [Clostridia bacterium]
MKDLPLISVVVPCHNSQIFLSNCLKSLDAQTYENVEFLMVDDGSTDDTFKILSAHAENNPKYKILQANGAGVSTARNIGIDNAQGEFITFLDSDDMYSPYHLELLQQHVNACGADTAVIDYLKVPEGKAYETFRFAVPEDVPTEEFDNKVALEEFLAQLKFEFSVWNKMYSGNVIREHNVRFLDGCRYNEDSLFNYKYFKHAQKTVLIHWLTYLYVQRKNSLVHMPFNEYKLDAYFSLNNILKDAYENRPDVIHYAHSIRVALSCEIIYIIKRSKYDNGAVIRKIIDYIKTDAKHLKYCKRTHRYRRVLIPLVPPVAKLLLCRRRKSKTGTLPKQFDIIDF